MWLTCCPSFFSFVALSSKYSRKGDETCCRPVPFVIMSHAHRRPNVMLTCCSLWFSYCPKSFRSEWQSWTSWNRFGTLGPSSSGLGGRRGVLVPSCGALIPLGMLVGVLFEPLTLSLKCLFTHIIRLVRENCSQSDQTANNFSYKIT